MNTRTKKIVVVILILMGVLILLPIINELKPSPNCSVCYYNQNECCWDTTYTQLIPTTYIPPEVLFVATFGLVVLISLLISFLMTYCDDTEECTCPLCGNKHIKRKEEEK